MEEVVDKLSEAAFALKAIPALRKKPWKGIHVVYSGLNSAIREYFQDDPVELVNRLVKRGVVEIRCAQGGMVIYLPGEAPLSGGQEALRKMGLLGGKNGNARP